MGGGIQDLGTTRIWFLPCLVKSSFSGPKGCGGHVCVCVCVCVQGHGCSLSPSTRSDPYVSTKHLLFLIYFIGLIRLKGHFTIRILLLGKDPLFLVIGLTFGKGAYHCSSPIIAHQLVCCHQFVCCRTLLVLILPHKNPTVAHQCLLVFPALVQQHAKWNSNLEC
jgi:hypothetical protein